ncbi:MAG: hypothetical protein JNN08_28055 [Bryobacterales bacterium]|nr:hypothetical protein [Bryobacterales bacterium]
MKEIAAGGAQPIVDILVQDLTEPQALRLEAELIAAFGTIDSGGMLTNSVLPSGLGAKKRRGMLVPLGCVERIQLGLDLLNTAIVDLAGANTGGMTLKVIGGGIWWTW